MASSSDQFVADDDITQLPFDVPLSPSPSISAPFEERPRPRLKGRQRLLAGLHRISSSQSVSRLGHSPRGYNGAGKGSISCISLNSATSLGSSLNREFSPGFSTAPTSAVTTPGNQIPALEDRARLRYVAARSADGKDSVALPSDVRPAPAAKVAIAPGIAEVNEDYFSRPFSQPRAREKDFNFWRDVPSELKMEILSYLTPRQVVRCSAVSRSWHGMCFDGQLWSKLDTAAFYQDIPADALVNIILSAGPFVRDLNLRGCVQLRDRWHAKGLSDACRNLENFSLEGCRIDRTAIHNLLYQNSRLVHINLCGLAGATNSALKIIATNCPRLEHLNVSWCNNIDTRGLKRIVEGCPGLRDLRASEIRGWDDVDFAHQLFLRNTLERLILINCDSLTDDALAVIIEGRDNDLDHLTGRPVVAARKLKHIDLTRCRGITDQGVRTFVNNLPELEGLQLSKCRGILDATLIDLLPTIPNLTHLDLEELEDLTNAVLQTLAASPCAKRLRHLSISYCENLGDTGMLPVLKTCTSLRTVEMDNTRISDLVLAEAAAMMKQRAPRFTLPQGGDRPVFRPTIGLSLVAYDCQNVTWTGVREILHRNADMYVSPTTHSLPPPPPHLPAKTPPDADADAEADVHLPSSSSSSSSAHNNRSLQPRRSTSVPSQIIHLKCFYTYQPTVEEHTKRVLRGDFAAAKRLEKKWAEFMIAQEEAGAAGAGARRRRRRAREAQMMHADEQLDDPDGGGGDGGGAGGGGDGGPAGFGTGVGGGRRRRARSGGCAVM